MLIAARQLAWANGAFARVVLMSGDPTPAIVSLAEQLAVDLIVIGRSRSRVPAVLAARTRCHIQHAAPCPVRIVAPPGPCGSDADSMTTRPGISSGRC